MYDHPDGDISVIQKNLGGTNLAGFFVLARSPDRCRQLPHGHTASLAIFQQLNCALRRSSLSPWRNEE
jgi:small ligand-binding sensory domain FIST